jgi:hypothetical protein
MQSEKVRLKPQAADRVGNRMALKYIFEPAIAIGTRALRRIRKALTPRRYKLFYQNCLISQAEIQIYGQFSKDPPSSIDIKINGRRLQPEQICLAVSKERPDFLMRLQGVCYSRNDCYTVRIDGRKVLSDAQLLDPVEGGLSFAACTIATMVKNGRQRILEWITYHLAIGFDRIVVFTNNSTDGTDALLASLGDPRVVVVPFPYTPFPGWHWNSIQRIELCLSANLLRNCSEWVCFTDIDEFILVRDGEGKGRPSLKTYLANVRRVHPDATAVKMGSYFFTNEDIAYEPNQDIVGNCLLRTVDTGYDKVIVLAEHLPEFIVTPHRFNGAYCPSVERLYIGHYWLRPERSPEGPFVFSDEIASFATNLSQSLN